MIDNAQLLSWIVGAVGISGFLLAGRKVWWAWYVNIACQVFWVLYAIASNTPAFFVTAFFYTAVFAYNAWRWTKDRKKVEEESNLVKHARTELALVGEDQDVIDWYVRVIKEYSSFGHSGGSHSAIVPTLNQLLNFKPLMPLTSSPDEWLYHGEDIWGEEGGIWQNTRDSRCFSKDFGRTYTMVDDPRDENGERPIYSVKWDGKRGYIQS